MHAGHSLLGVAEGTRNPNKHDGREKLGSAFLILGADIIRQLPYFRAISHNCAHTAFPQKKLLPRSDIFNDQLTTSCRRDSCGNRVWGVGLVALEGQALFQAELDDTVRVSAFIQFRVQPGSVLVRFLMAVDAGRRHGEVREAGCGLGLGCRPSRP